MEKYDVNPTIKQKKVFEEVIKGNSFRSAMIKAGYSIESATNPKNVTESVGWKQLTEIVLPDEALMRVHVEGLQATIKKPIVVGKGKKGKAKYAYIVEQDHNTRFKYLDLAYKIKGKYNDNKVSNWSNFWNEKSKEIREEYK